MIQREFITKLVPLILDLHDSIVAYLEGPDMNRLHRNGAVRMLGLDFYDKVSHSGLSIYKSDRNDVGDIVVRASQNTVDGKNPADFVGLMLQELDCHCDIHN